jgi:hypothetical protein
MSNKLVCEAIRTRSLLEFDYDGLRRVVAPYCHGTSARGQELLRGVQLRGESRSGGLGFGKLWLVAKIRNACARAEAFVPDDPDYNPDDRAMAEIHCRI